MELEVQNNPAILENVAGISRRGTVKYTKNPFIERTIESTTTKKKKVTNKIGHAYAVVRDDFNETGEIIEKAGFYTYETVDNTQFIKLYINGVAALAELSSAGHKAFKILYIEMQKNINKDKIILSFTEINQKETPIGRTSFMKGIKELIMKDFIAETTISSVYFVNPDFMWNGDRLQIVNEYIRDRALNIETEK